MSTKTTHELVVTPTVATGLAAGVLFSFWVLSSSTLRKWLSEKNKFSTITLEINKSRLKKTKEGSTCNYNNNTNNILFHFLQSTKYKFYI